MALIEIDGLPVYLLKMVIFHGYVTNFNSSENFEAQLGPFSRGFWDHHTGCGVLVFGSPARCKP
jgi:hypothetical protein